MPLLVTGSIGIDTVETPFGKRDDVVGGSAIYFSYAASFFTPVRLVGVVGEGSVVMRGCSLSRVGGGWRGRVRRPSGRGSG